MEQFGIKLDMIVETQLSVNEFRDKFIAWVEANGWVTGGIMYSCDEDGERNTHE